jgi:hypothetical protein
VTEQICGCRAAGSSATKSDRTRRNSGWVAQVFDLAGITNTVGMAHAKNSNAGLPFRLIASCAGVFLAEVRRAGEGDQRLQAKAIADSTLAGWGDEYLGIDFAGFASFLKGGHEFAVDHLENPRHIGIAGAGQGGRSAVREAHTAIVGELEAVRVSVGELLGIGDIPSNRKVAAIALRRNAVGGECENRHC